MKPVYLTNCISCSDGDEINDMKAQAREITYESFAKAVDSTSFAGIRESLGYSRTFPMRKDWHVSYFRSKFRGEPCYYLTWSAIEYIFSNS